MHIFSLGKKIVFSFLVMVPLLFMINYQHQLMNAGELGGIAKGENWHIHYALKKESRGEWLLDMNFSAVGGQSPEIQETHTVFIHPITHEIVTRAKGSNENYRLEGHVLSNTEKLNETEITEVLNQSYVIIKWLNEKEEPVEEKIYINDLK